MTVINTKNSSLMEHPDFIDGDMQELLDELGKAVVPAGKRRAVVRTNYHTPYYMNGRYRRL